MKALRIPLVLFISLLLAIGPLASLSAQDASSTPAGDAAVAGILAEFEVNELPHPMSMAYLIRTTLSADFQNSPGSYPGTVVLLVESGTLTVNAQSSVMVAQGGDQVHESSGEIIMEPGDSVLIPRDISFSYRTSPDESVSLMMLLLVSTRDEEQGGQQSGEVIQMADHGLVIGAGGFPPIRGTITIERVVAQPGEVIDGPGVTRDIQMAGWMGIDMGFVETGSAELEIITRSDYNIIWGDSDPNVFMEPRFVTLTATETLEPGDGYAFYDSELTWTVTGDEQLTLLRVVIIPEFGEFGN